MSKIIPFALAGAGAAATSVGTTYLIKGTSGVMEQKLEFEDVSKFEEGFNNAKCVNGLFSSDVNKPDSIPDISGASPAAGAFFRTDAPKDTDPFKSCLKLEHQTTKYKDDKWDGKFTWTWTFVRGDEGFINFNVAETDDKDEGKLKFSGIFYLVGKNNNKWSIKHKKSVAANKKTDSSGIDTHFPKASDALKDQHKDYWGFFEDSGRLSKICRDNSCKTEPSPRAIVKKEFSWAKGEESAGAKKLSEWSRDVNWWNNLYGATPWSLDTKTSGFKGIWSAKP